MNTISHILFDYGGVLAEEGFVAGLAAIARAAKLNEQEFFAAAERIIYDCRFVTGACDEKVYWQRMREETGIRGSDAELTRAILEQFRLRPLMLELIDELSAKGIIPVILSDQTDWLDRLETRDRFFHRFARVFNSYHTGISKREPACFTMALAELAIEPSAALFVDDNSGHCERAAALGIHVHHFSTPARFKAELGQLGVIK